MSSDLSLQARANEKMYYQSIEGDLVLNKKIAISDGGVCNGCLDEMARLIPLYRRDFENRTGVKVLLVIPWPAVKLFSWPPHAAVLDGIDVRKKEFAIAITADYLLAGRRSFEGQKLEVAEALKEVESDPSLSNAYREDEIETIRRHLEAIEKRRKVNNERQLFSIPLERMSAFTMESRGDFIAVSFMFRNLKDTLHRGRQEIKEKQILVISKEFEAAMICLEKMAGLKAIKTEGEFPKEPRT
jgi:hypothetical protein